MARDSTGARFGGLRRALTVLASAALLGCAMRAGPPAAPAPDAAAETDRAQVLAQLARYEAAVRRMDTVSLAALFEVDGVADDAHSTPIRGRAAIKAFLDSFAAYHVVSHVNRADRTLVEGDRATQTGIYDQTVITPEGRSVHVNGLFTATWARQGDGTWLLQRMHTQPPS